MSRTRRAIRLVAGNLAVLLLIVMVLNLIAAVAMEVQFVFRKAFFETDDRVSLPNYDDKEEAKTILDELRDLRTDYRPYEEWNRKP